MIQCHLCYISIIITRSLLFRIVVVTEDLFILFPRIFVQYCIYFPNSVTIHEPFAFGMILSDFIHMTGIHSYPPVLGMASLSTPEIHLSKYLIVTNELILALGAPDPIHFLSNWYNIYLAPAPLGAAAISPSCKHTTAEQAEICGTLL